MRVIIPSLDNEEKLNGWYKLEIYDPKNNENFDITCLLYYINGHKLITHFYFEKTNFHYETVSREDGSELNIDDQYVLKLSYLLRLNMAKILP